MSFRSSLRRHVSPSVLRHQRLAALGGPSISLSAPDFGGSIYYEGVDDDDVTVTINNATDGASYALTISSSGGGTNVTASGTVSGGSVSLGAQDLTGLNAGTLTFSYEEASVEVATRTRTLAAQAVPSAPTITSVTWLDEQATVTIGAGSPNGAAITDHIWEYNEDSGGWTAFNAGTSTALTGTTPALTKGADVVFRVRSTNSIGTGSNSSDFASVVPATVPGQVSSISTSPSTGTLTASWSAPSDTGGAAITDYLIGYRLNSAGGAFTTFNDGVSSVTGAAITGLTDGVAYDIEISAVNSVGIGEALVLSNQTPADGVTYDYYVDSVNGDDANAGTEAAPFQTLAQATTALASAGTALALVRGSVWEEKFTVPRTGFTIGVVGTGAAPLFEGSKEFDGTWTAHTDSASYPDVWEQAVTRAGGSATEVTSLWADDVMPTYQESLADLQANGGWYVSDLTGTDPTFYIKSAVDPNSDGVEYRFSALDEGIAAHSSQGGESADVIGPIELNRYYGAYGNYAGGQFDDGGSDKQLLFGEGAIHHMVSEAVTSEDCIALGVVPHGTASSAFTWYRADGAGFDPVVKRCGVWTGYDDHTEPLTRRGAFNVHDSDFPVQCTVEYEQMWSRAGERSISASAVSMLDEGLYSWNCSAAWYGVSVTNTVRYGISRQTPGSGSSGYTDSGPEQTAEKTVVIEDVVFYAPPAAAASSLAGIAARNGSFTFRRCTFIMAGVEAPSTMLACSAETEIDLVVENCLFVRSGSTASGVQRAINLTEATSTYVGTNNLFVGGGTTDNDAYIDVTVADTNYRSLADLQAAGYDTNSVHIGQGWTFTQIINNLFEGDPTQGDFRLKSDLSAYGTFGNGAALTTAGVQTHWDWDNRTTASGAPKQWPVPPWSVADCRTYVDDPTAWSFYDRTPGAVSDLDAIASATLGAVDLTWTVPVSADGVSQGMPTLKVSTDNVTFTDATNVAFTSLGGLTAAARVSSLTAGTDYYWKVVYTNEAGAGSDSNTAEGSPSAIGDAFAALANANHSGVFHAEDASSMYVETDGDDGTTVTDGDSVGLWLDRSFGGDNSTGLTAAEYIAAQSNLLSTTPGDWTQNNGGVLTYSDGEYTLTSPTGSGAAIRVEPVTAGRLYIVEMTATAATDGALIRVGDSANATRFSQQISTSPMTLTTIIYAVENDFRIQAAKNGSSSDETNDVTFTATVRELPGQHMVMPSDGARPIYRSADGGYVEADGSADSMPLTSMTQTTDMNMALVMRTTDTDFELISGETSTGDYIGRAEDGSSSTTISANAGSPTITVDDTALSGSARDDLHTDIADDAWHKVEIEGADMSTSWTDGFNLCSNQDGSVVSSIKLKALIAHDGTGMSAGDETDITTWVDQLVPA